MAAESTLLTINREELVKNIRFVEPFLDKLLQRNQLTTEECDVVRSGRTPQDRARALIDLVGTKGQEAFSHFRHALKQTNPELEDILHRCVDHNKRIKLHCDDCVQLLCRTCSKEGHKGHRVSSIVADAWVIRREVTAFVRDNRKLLKNFNTSGSEEEGRQNVLLDIELRKNALKAMFIEKIESEYEWCKDQLGVGDSVASPAASISSVATTESELSSRHGTDLEPPRSPKAKIRRGARNHPYSPVDQNSRGTQPRSPAWGQHRTNRMPSSLNEMIRMYLPPSPIPSSVAFPPPTSSLSPSQSPSQEIPPTSSSLSQNLNPSPTSPALGQHRAINRHDRMPGSLNEMIRMYLPSSPTPSSVAFTPPTHSPSQSPSQDLLPTSSSPSPNLNSSFTTRSSLTFPNRSPSVRYSPASRSPLSPISFSRDSSYCTLGRRYPAPSFHSQRLPYALLDPYPLFKSYI